MLAEKKRMINLETMIKIDSELNQIQDVDILLERILLEARNVVRADAGSIYVWQSVEEQGEKIEKIAIKYAQNETLQGKLPPGEKLLYSVFSIPISDKTISGYCALTKNYFRLLRPDQKAGKCYRCL